ncbi:MAG: isoleucine--tRNA ligase [Alphaproteobacteria bacterium]
MTTHTKQAKQTKQGDKWRQTVFLPKTTFPMRGQLPQNEPKILELWDNIQLFELQRKQASGKEKFILHDGPPYANGNLHIGTALNKILKDVINRTQQTLGKDANYVPGWDCHGLPIEWMVEEKLRAAGHKKEDIPPVQFRKKCRNFAEKWIHIQRQGFQRYGVIGDWKNPYLTMTGPAEAQIVRELGKFILDKSLYRAAKPVLWSVPEATALADAEVEYRQHESPSIWVAYPPKNGPLAKINAHVVIWTTTPWTIPGSHAVAFLNSADYVVIADPNNPNSKFAIARQCLQAFQNAANLQNTQIIQALANEDLANSILHHPLAKHGYNQPIPLLPADFVTLEQGSGFVHTAPAHGPDDHALCKKHGITGRDWIDADSRFHPDTPLFANTRILNDDGTQGNANPQVINALKNEGALLAHHSLQHSYPHSWRSRAPLIFRTTSQWFIPMDSNGLRKVALTGIQNTNFYPPESRERLASMVAERPDWCISRQRLWGVPLPLFVHKQNGEILRDPKIIERIATAYENQNSDLWFTQPPEYWLNPEYNANDWQQQSDIVEVWFDSGATHSFVLEARDNLKWPADLYLEGTDQHRGWFQSSLLVACATRNRPPYDAILTHGFVLDDEGQKMSKSLGNTTDPEDVIKESGADILRLWVVASDYSKDLRIGPAILTQVRESYRRLRNSLRYLLGGLNEFHNEERIAVSEMPILEKWLLHQLAKTDDQLRKAVEEYDYHRVFLLLHHLANSDLSSFYFDVRKDALYCDSPDNPRRRAVRTVFDLCFDFLCGWLAPILAFTAEEAWQARGKEPKSVHLRVLQPPPQEWRDEKNAASCERLRELRTQITNALERAREHGVLNTSLAARIVLQGVQLTPQEEETLAELAIVAEVKSEAAMPSNAPSDAPSSVSEEKITEKIVVQIETAQGERCDRCWRVRPEVSAQSDGLSNGLCTRCSKVIADTPRNTGKTEKTEKTEGAGEGA